MKRSANFVDEALQEVVTKSKKVRDDSPSKLTKENIITEKRNRRSMNYNENAMLAMSPKTTERKTPQKKRGHKISTPQTKTPQQICKNSVKKKKLKKIDKDYELNDKESECSDSSGNENDENDENNVPRPNHIISTPSPGKRGNTPSKSAKKKKTPAKNKSTKKTKDEEDTVSKALKLLHISNIPETLVDRDEEYNSLQSFVHKRFESNTPGSFFMSGRPGTGKTAITESVLTEINEKYNKNIQIASLNCMRYTDLTSFFYSVLEKCGKKKVADKLPYEMIKLRDAFEEYICDVKKLEKKLLTVLLLDEVDQLCSTEALYHLFELPHLKNSSLVLITIANAHDLIPRLLPRLEAKSCAPEVLKFLQYNPQQIINIIKERLAGAGKVFYSQAEYQTYVEKNGGSEKQKETDKCLVFEESALKFSAGKISSLDGDVRKALDICRQAIETAKMKQKNSVVITVSMRQIFAIFQNIKNPFSSLLNNLPFHQQIILAILAKTRKDIQCYTLGKLKETYLSKCSNSLRDFAASQFDEACTGLEGKGLVEIGDRPNEKRLRKITLRVNEEQVTKAFENKAEMERYLK